MYSNIMRNSIENNDRWQDWFVLLTKNIKHNLKFQLCFLERYTYAGFTEIKPRANYILKSLCMHFVRLYVSFLTRCVRA